MKSRVVALAGNPNSGKTTVFNALCGTREKVGNWPGTTVERKEGIMEYAGKKIKIVDLPGIYGLSAYSIDERIARSFLIKEKPHLVVAVVDASNLERNLYLVAQLLEMGQKVLLNLNMLDIASSRGIRIDKEKLSKILGVQVVETIASRGVGIEKLKEEIVKGLEERGKREHLKISYGSDVETAIKKLEEIIGKNKDIGMSLRGMAIKLLEGDQEFIEKFKDSKDFDEIKRVIEETEKLILRKTGDDLETFIIERRYAFLKGLVKECTLRERSLEERLTLSDKIDKILTNRILGLPIFLLAVYALFQLVFYVGNPIADIIDGLFGDLTTYANTLCAKIGAPDWFSSLISDGVISGVGSVLVFLPNIALLFLGISILEDSGYLARAAFIMDRVMHALGLHGKSFIPMLIGFGCNVPAIMATRTLESRKDRILTILVNPLMSCSARLPVYTLFASAFFSEHQGLIVFSLYITGIVLAIIVARIFKNFFFKEESAPLVMELPPYRLPTLRNVFTQVYLRSSIFIKKAGTIIVLAVILIWALSSLPPGVDYASEESLIGKFGKTISPILEPAGFGNWQSAVALSFGILAKETVVGTLGTLYGAEEESLKEALKENFTPLSAYAFLLMTLIYIPCIATIAAIKRETNWKWTIIAVSYSFILGWTVSVAFYQIARIL